MPLYAGMSDGAPPTDEVRLILQRHRLAVVGLSPRPDRPSHRAMVHMAANGYEITPVNPACDEVMGNACTPRSRRPPRWAARDRRHLPPGRGHPPIVDEAIELGAEVIWMQLGLSSPEAAARARDAGLEVVEDRCIKMEHCR